MKLIDADALKAVPIFNGAHDAEHANEHFIFGIESVMEYINNMPAIDILPAVDAVPVVHGEWEAMHYEGGILDGSNFDRCSICKWDRFLDDPKIKSIFLYCPHCGAKMDGQRREED